MERRSGIKAEHISAGAVVHSEFSCFLKLGAVLEIEDILLFTLSDNPTVFNNTVAETADSAESFNGRLFISFVTAVFTDVLLLLDIPLIVMSAVNRFVVIDDLVTNGAACGAV